jgi:putative transposase
MARPLRIQYPGAVYHVTCRGNERKEIYKDDRDRKTFLEILARSLQIYTVNLFSYVLMRNHFHLLVETPLGNLGEFMRHFNVSYTSYYNKRHKRIGHLYQGRYKSIIVDKESYLSILSRYMHLNSIRVGEMKKKTDKEKVEFLKSYSWSSLPGYLSKRKKEEFIDYAMVLEEYGGDNDSGRVRYKNRIYTDISEGLEIKEKITGQSILGGDKFIGWIRETFLQGKRDRECPPMRHLQRYKSKEEVFAAIKSVTGKRMEEVISRKDSLRHITMDLLYRMGGLTGVEIGRIIGVDYSTVSQGRKRLRERIQKDKSLRKLLNQIEQKLSI